LRWPNKTFAGVQTCFQADSKTLQTIEQQNLVTHCAAFLKIHSAPSMLDEAYETAHQFFPPLPLKTFA